MIKEEERQFFALKTGMPHRANMGGKRVALANFPEDAQKQIKERIAEKDEIQRKGQLGILPGLKIDGKQVTKDNIHEFEIKPKKEEETKKPVIEEPKAKAPKTKVKKTKKNK